VEVKRRALAMTIVGMLLGNRGTAEPIRLHPDNPRYFLYRGRPTVLVTSAEHYGAVLNRDFDYRAYLKELKSAGLNHTRLFSGTYREVKGSFGITDNTLAPEPARFACPWKRGDVPGAPDGGNKFDLTGFDPAYFSRLRDFMKEAERCGVVVELNLFCPHYDESLWQVSPMNAAGNVNGIGDCPREEVYTLKAAGLTGIQEEVTRKIVRETNGFDNLYYEVCNEPYAGVVTKEWQDKIAAVIVETEAGLAKKHLISLNVANHRAEIRDPNPAVSIFNFHYCVPPDVVDMNYGLGKPIGENETGFRGNADVIYRTEGWEFMVAGGALYNNLDYSFTASHPRGDFSGYSSPGGGSPALRSQLRILKEFIEGFDFVRMAPDKSVVKEVRPEGLHGRALSEPGKAYALYLHFPPGEKSDVKFDTVPRNASAGRDLAVTARLLLALPAGRYRAEWVDTLTGKVEKREDIPHPGGDAVLGSPSFRDDIALRITGR
jgi:hypothetical protein